MNTGLVQINARTLPDLADGQAELVINKALSFAMDDLDDRGERDGKERVVVLEVHMKREKGITLVDVVAPPPKIPAFRTDRTACKSVARKDGGVALMFQVFNAENPDQPVFKEMEDSRPVDYRNQKGGLDAFDDAIPAPPGARAPDEDEEAEDADDDDTDEDAEDE